MLIRRTEAMAVDNQAAVAALVGAKDIEALEAAIAAASFLDSIPGDDRQKLRGARGGGAPSGRFMPPSLRIHGRPAGPAAPGPP